MKNGNLIKELVLPEVSVFTALHISDLHFGRKNDKFTDRYDSRYLKDIPRDQTDLNVDLIKSLNDNHIEAPSACIVSGDLVEAGEIVAAYDDVFANFLKMSQEWFKSNNDHFVIIPGNHDVSWPKKFRTRDRIADAYKMALSDFYSSDLKKYKDRGDFLCDIKLFKCKNFSVLICGIESTLVETETLRGIGYISQFQREMIEKAMMDKALIEDHLCIKVAVIHHHVIPVTKDIELEMERYESDFKKNPEIKNTKASLTYDAREFMRWLAKNKFSMVLHGHQHTPFLTTEHERRGKYKEIVVAGVGSVSKIISDEVTTERTDNYFNYLTISPDEGIQITTYRANKKPLFGFKKEEDGWHFPIYHSGLSISRNLSNKLDSIDEPHKAGTSRSKGGDIYEIDVTEFFEESSLTIALREILISFGVLIDENGKTIIKYHDKDQLPFSFLKILSRCLKLRGEKHVSLLGDWADYPVNKHNSLDSPLLFLANFERRWYSSHGLKGVDLRKDKYILYPLFRNSKGKLEILLYLHEAWRVYLIPTRNPSKEADDLYQFKRFPFMKGFKKETHLKKLNKECICTKVIARQPRPSPSRGLLTLHEYDMQFYSLTEYGFKDLDNDRKGWRWFSFEECSNLGHVKVSDDVRVQDIQFGEGGLFNNNLDLVGFAFKKARELSKKRVLDIYG
ncbi:metallophosphoesterase family protein [Thermodesulfobacteriota bacterium]